MENLFELIVKALAVWRISNLLVDEDGPYDIARKIRAIANDKNQQLGAMLDCLWCTSVWVALFVTFIPYDWIVILMPFALSAGALYVNKLVKR